MMRDEKTSVDVIDALLDESSRLDVRLRAALGDDGFFSLLRAYSGTRLYIPMQRVADSDISAAITVEQADVLSRAFGGSYIRIPLCREFMLVQFAKKGYSNREIARSFGMTESGVESMKKRVRARGELLDVAESVKPFKSVIEDLSSVAPEAIGEARQDVLSGNMDHRDIYSELKTKLTALDINIPDFATFARWARHHEQSQRSVREVAE